MSLIITATDFSEVAENAVNYACRLASAQNAQVIIVHSFIIPVMFSDVPMPASIVTDAQADAEENMNNLVARMTTVYPGLPVQGTVIYGDTVGVLDEYAAQNKSPWLIVVGNKGPEEAASWPDSTLMNVLKKLEYPVLAVPAHFGYQPVKRICFAYDNKHKGNDIALQQVKDLSMRMGAELHVLTIRLKNAGSDVPAAIDEGVKSLLAGANPSYHFVNDAGDIDNTINDFISNNNIDLLIVLPRKHSFFEGLFHKSHTKSIALHTRIPILALHENNS